MTKRKQGKQFDFGKMPPDFALARQFTKMQLKPKDEDGAIGQWVERMFSKEHTRRLAIIARHYNLDFDNSECLPLLVFFLARDFVPEFDAYKNGRGAPRKTIEQGNTAFAVMKIMDERRCSISEACDILRKRQAKKGVVRTSDEIEAEYHRFFSSMKEANDLLDTIEQAAHESNLRNENARPMAGPRDGTILGSAEPLSSDGTTSENGD